MKRIVFVYTTVFVVLFLRDFCEKSISSFISINFNYTLVSSTHTLPVNIFNLKGGETMLARDKGNFRAPGENRTRDPASFCQQVDDWTLLKITEKIIQRNVF